MNLQDFIITNGKAAGLSNDEIAGMLQSAHRKLPGNVPEERYEEQVMEWINRRAKINKEEKEKQGSIKSNNRSMDER